jgi:hypothetical protein
VAFCFEETERKCITLDVVLQLQLSDSQKVTVGNINLAATGMYRCEVSAEAPSFTSVNGEGLMEVIGMLYYKYYVLIHDT